MDQTLDTLPKQFIATAKKHGSSKVAVRQKVFGIWQEYTWQESYEIMRDITLGLSSLGVERGQRVSIVGDNDRFYLWADIAIMAVGCAAVGCFTDATPEEMRYVIDHSDAVLAFAKDQEQCDKLLEIKEQIPNVQKVIYWDDRGMWGYDDPWLMSFDSLVESGAALHAEKPHLFEQLVSEGKGSDYANYCYTSGTTGLPKGAMLSHSNFLSASGSLKEVLGVSENDNILSFAPLAWIAEHTLALTPHTMYGMVVNFPESPETVQGNIREIAPDVIFYPARLWENITGLIQAGINDATLFNRWLFSVFLPISYRAVDLRFENKSVPFHLTLLNQLGDFLVFKPLRNQLGFTKIRHALTAGAALSPDMMRYYHAIGLNLKQIFASTETAAVGTIHYDNDIKYASVGKPYPGMGMQVSDEGEIWLGGGPIFHGYHKNEEATAESLHTDDGGMRWFMTGDAGYIDEDGHLIYLDRLKDMIELSSGDKYSPQFIEGRLKFSPYIRDAMTIGGVDRDYVAALIAIDFNNVSRWAEKGSIAFTTYVDLSQRDEIYELIRQDIERVNESLPETGRVRRFVLLHKEFDADEAEMTRTRKLRRGFLAERYSGMIDSIYNGEETVAVSAAFRYQDGREGTIETDIRIMTLEERMGV